MLGTRKSPTREDDIVCACREEFGGAIREMGLMLNEEELKLLFNEHDADGNGNIDSAEFTSMVMRYKDGDRCGAR